MRSRVTRAMKQRMFVMSRELSASDDSVEKFEVLGSIGNVSRYILLILFFTVIGDIELICLYHRITLSLLHLPSNVPVWIMRLEGSTASIS